ncbi:hypothetical protein QJS04_geneDACA020299 [Acorus gramineus]|uniref:Transposase n=1 Tax=Acorus gramineus TaxID=55184 RepID=A0AAV9ABD7_ACOGR|nr:hypothetical protein QJS04_geneDACA020299 [Acorus gramineus]
MDGNYADVEAEEPLEQSKETEAREGDERQRDKGKTVITDELGDMQAEKATEGDARQRTEDGELGEDCENVCSESSYHELGKGLDDAVKVVFPQAEHRACMRHLYKNFKRKYPGEFLERLVWSAARAYTPQWHVQFMRQIEVVSKEALNYLLAEKDHCWSRAMFGETARCHYLTNNMSGSFNAFVGDARFKPIIYCIDAIRQKLMKITHNRRIKAQQWTGVLVPEVQKQINELRKGNGGYDVHRSTDVRAEVDGPEGRFDVTGIPCKHATAVLSSIRGVNLQRRPPGRPAKKQSRGSLSVGRGIAIGHGRGSMTIQYEAGPSATNLESAAPPQEGGQSTVGRGFVVLHTFGELKAMMESSQLKTIDLIENDLAKELV